MSNNSILRELLSKCGMLNYLAVFEANAIEDATLTKITRAHIEKLIPDVLGHQIAVADAIEAWQNEQREQLLQPEEEKPKPSTFQDRCSNEILGILRTESLALKRKDGRTKTMLMDFQLDALLKTRDLFFDEFTGKLKEPIVKSGLIVAPPGSGKSGMVTLLPFVLESYKVLVLTPNVVISDQIKHEFASPDITKRFLVKCGLYKADETVKLNNRMPSIFFSKGTEDIARIPNYELSVMNAQKFAGKSQASLNPLYNQNIPMVNQALKEFDTIIVDEAHHIRAETWKLILERFKGKKIVLLTATPYTGTIGNMQKIDLEGLEYVYTIRHEDVEGKTTRKLEFLQENMSHAHFFSPDFFNKLANDINKVFEDHKKQESRFEGKQQGLVLVSNKSECAILAKELEERGISAVPVTSDNAKDTNLQDFNEGKKTMAVVCQMLLEGYDNSNVTLCIILRKCTSPTLFNQFVGRCTRVKRGLIGKQDDKTLATVMSYDMYEQKKLFELRDIITLEEYPYENEGEEGAEGETPESNGLAEEKKPKGRKRGRGPGKERRGGQSGSGSGRRSGKAKKVEVKTERA